MPSAGRGHVVPCAALSGAGQVHPGSGSTGRRGMGGLNEGSTFAPRGVVHFVDPIMPYPLGFLFSTGSLVLCERWEVSGGPWERFFQNTKGCCFHIV